MRAQLQKACRNDVKPDPMKKEERKKRKRGRGGEERAGKRERSSGVRGGQEPWRPKPRRRLPCSRPACSRSPKAITVDMARRTPKSWQGGPDKPTPTESKEIREREREGVKATLHGELARNNIRS